MRRIPGRSPKLPIGAVSNPHFKDSIYQNGSPVTQTECVSKLRGVQKASLQSDFACKFNLALNPSSRELKSEQLCGDTVLRYQRA